MMMSHEDHHELDVSASLEHDIGHADDEDEDRDHIEKKQRVAEQIVAVALALDHHDPHDDEHYDPAALDDDHHHDHHHFDMNMADASSSLLPQDGTSILDVDDHHNPLPDVGSTAPNPVNISYDDTLTHDPTDLTEVDTDILLTLDPQTTSTQEHQERHHDDHPNPSTVHSIEPATLPPKHRKDDQKGQDQNRDHTSIIATFPIASIFPENAAEYKKLGLASHLVPAQLQVNLEQPPPTTKTAAPSMRTLKRPRDRAIGKAVHEIYPNRSSCIEKQLRLYYQEGDPQGAAFPWLHHPDFSATPGRIRREAETLLPFVHAAACGSTHNAANILYHLLQRPELSLVKSLLMEKLTPPSQDTDSCIASGVIQFLDYHGIPEQTRARSPPNKTAQAVEAVVQAACWDVSKANSVPQSRLANRLGFSQSGPVRKARRKAQDLIENQAYFEPTFPKMRKDCVKQEAHNAIEAFWHSEEASYIDHCSKKTYHVHHPLTNQLDPSPHPQRTAHGTDEYLFEAFLTSEYYLHFQDLTGNATIAFSLFRQYKCDCIGRPTPQQESINCTEYQQVSRILDNALPDMIQKVS
jgi:hypothetical protein